MVQEEAADRCSPAPQLWTYAFEFATMSLRLGGRCRSDRLHYMSLASVEPTIGCKLQYMERRASARESPIEVLQRDAPGDAAVMEFGHVAAGFLQPCRLSRKGEQADAGGCLDSHS